MSTRIIGGVRFLDRDIGAVLDRLESIRPDVESAQRACRATWLARHAVATLDDAVLKGEPLPDALSVAWDGFEAARAEVAKGLSRPTADFGFKVSVLRHRDEVLGIAFVEDARLLALLDPPVADPYGYWDGEAPDGVGNDEWEARRTAWEEALGPLGVPMHRGVTFEHEWRGWTSPEDVVAAAPDRADRAKRAVVRMERDRFVQARVEDGRGDVGSRVVSEFVQDMGRFAEWSRSEDGVRRIAALAADAEALLPDVDESYLKGEAPASRPR